LNENSINFDFTAATKFLNHREALNNSRRNTKQTNKFVLKTKQTHLAEGQVLLEVIDD